LSKSRIAPRSPLNKRAAEAEANWLATQPRDVKKSLRTAAGASVVTPLAIKQASNVLAEATREAQARLTGKQRRIRGFKAVPDPRPGAAGRTVLVEINRAPMAVEMPSEIDLAMVAELARLLARAKPQQQAASEWLQQIRRAHHAAFGRPPQDAWQETLRTLIDFTLRFRLAGHKPPAGHPRTGAEIERELRRIHGENVPPSAMGKAIDAILRDSTLARGGGRGGKTNAARAVDKLIATVKLRR